MKWSILTVLGLGLSLVIALFAIYNDQPVIVSYFFGKARVSAVILILGSALAGALAMALLGIVRHIKVSFQIKDLNRQNREQAEELERLKEENEGLKVMLSRVESKEQEEQEADWAAESETEVDNNANNNHQV